LRFVRRRYHLQVIALFIVLRLMVLIVFPAGQLTLYGDYPYYYYLAAYSDQGYLPYIDYWSEYPPLFPFLSVGIYQLGRLFGGGYQTFVTLLGLLLVVVEAGNLLLLLRLAERIHGKAIAARIGWVYSLLFVPLLHTWWQFDALTTMFLLLSLMLLMEGKEEWSAASMGLGVLAKLLPILVFPVMVRTRSWRRWLPYGLVSLGLVALVVVPLMLLGGEVALASVESLWHRSSWQTVWALLDGNLGTGLLGPPSDHFDVAKATAPVGNPASVPGWVRMLLVAPVYAFVFCKAHLDGSPRRQVAFVSFSLILFFLWSVGWSPQWQTVLFPLLLLTLPLRRSIPFVLILSLVNLAEWPVLLSLGLNQWLYVTVTLRTTLFVVLLVVVGRLFLARPVDGPCCDPSMASETT
jgi:hypothetical protein